MLRCWNSTYNRAVRLAIARELKSFRDKLHRPKINKSFNWPSLDDIIETTMDWWIKGMITLLILACVALLVVSWVFIKWWALGVLVILLPVILLLVDTVRMEWF